MRELETKGVEGSMSHVAQKVRLLHAAQADLNHRSKNIKHQTPSALRKAENDVLFHERNLGGVLEELVDEANKLLREIDPGQSVPVPRMAADRGD